MYLYTGIYIYAVSLVHICYYTLYNFINVVTFYMCVVIFIVYFVCHLFNDFNILSKYVLVVLMRKPLKPNPLGQYSF